MSDDIKVSVVGAGYVGCVSIGCLTNDGLRVVAVDLDPYKVDQLNAGLAPLHEPGLSDLTRKGWELGLLTATKSIADGVRQTNLSMVCVGTPTKDDGSLDTRYVQHASEEIGKALGQKSDFHIVVMRSTILPGTMENIVIPALEANSGKRAGVDFGVAYYPEFLREGTAIADYYSPGAIVFGQFDDDLRSIDTLRRLCAGLPVAPHVISMRSAEIVKYTNNCWHAVKTSFANEIGNLCKAAGIDSHAVMDVVCSDTRLNISRAYMRPGYAYGGSCLPKDLRALTYLGRSKGIPTPMLDATEIANEVQFRRALTLVQRTGKRKVGMVGLTFKADTDDLRESPMLALAERLIGQGYEVRVFDPNVATEPSAGRNYLAHIAGLIRTKPEDVIGDAEVVVIGNKYDGVPEAIAAATHEFDLIDLVRIQIPAMKRNIRYEGLCW